MGGDVKDQSGKKGQKEKTFLQDRSTERGKMLHWYLLSFLALHLSGAASLTVHRPKGGSVSLPLPVDEKLLFRLTHGTKVAYGRQQYEQFKGRVIESGHGDLIIKDLKTTDAGKYTLNGFYDNDHPISYTYEIHILDNLTVRRGEELVLGDRPLDADKVEHCIGTVCSEIWRTGRGVLNDRLNDSHGRLAIREFRSTDAGIYRVLNSTGGELVTVTVTEYGTESEGNNQTSTEDHRTDDHRTDDTRQHYAWIVAPVALAPLIIFLITRQHLKRNKQQYSYRVEMAESDRVLEYSFVTATISRESDNQRNGYTCICIPGANSRHEGDPDRA